MTIVYVDADACPVKDEVMKVAERHNLITYIVSNSGMRVPRSPLVKQMIVSEGPDEADNWIVEQIGKGDIVITADIPLASRCLEKGAAALGPSGKTFTAENIGMSVAMRDLTSHLRETSDFKSYNPAFTQKDRSRFLSAMEETVRAVKRASDG